MRSRPMCPGSLQSNNNYLDAAPLRGGRLFLWGSTMARILIVDDSPTEMYKLTGMLEKHGH